MPHAQVWSFIGPPGKQPGQWTCRCIGQSNITKNRRLPLAYISTKMQATLTYTPLKPCASIQKGRKRLHMSRQSHTADKNLQLHRSLEPVELISSCCKNNCFAKFDNLDSLKSLRSTFFNFGTQTLKKQFMKELLLAGIPDQLDYMDKQFRLGDIPVAPNTCTNFLACQTLS